jgi:phage tail-like protein
MDIDSYALNYVTANRFYVEMDSELAACFSDCTGLGFDSKPNKFLEGGVLDQERLLIEPPKFTPLKLKRGITTSTVFWDWINQVWSAQAKRKRRNINILLFNQAGETSQCWTLIGAFPIGWKAPSLQAKSKTVAIEEITIAYEGFKVVMGTGGGGATRLEGRDSLGYFGSSASHG